MYKIILFLLLSAKLLNAQIIQLKDIYPGTTTTNNVTTPNSGNPTSFFPYNNMLLFRADDGVNGVELWKTDGTISGTQLVKNIASGNTNSNPGPYILMNGLVYFNATTGTSATGQELYVTDGTESGTNLVKDIRVGTASSNPNNFVLLNSNTILFSANDGTSGNELWKSNGTEAGTVIVKDYPGTTNSITTQAVMNGIAYQLQIVSTTGRELYRSDGTEAGSFLVKDINPGTTLGVGTELFVASNNTLYFAGNSGSTGLELWKSNGTEIGTVLVKDIASGSTASSPRRFVEMNGVVYFNATNGVDGTELWKTDGTEAGTIMVANINPGGNSNPDQLEVINNVLYFFAQEDGTTYDLYKYDGTTLTKLYDFNAPSNTVSTNYVFFDNKIYFGADSDASNSRELWVTDGTPAGTVSVASLFPSSINPHTVNNITLWNNKIYFSGVGDDGNELFVFDPATLSTNESSKSMISVYPNPAKSVLSLSGMTTDATYQIFDLAGREMVSGKLSVSQSSIPLNLTKGIYLLTLNQNGEKSTFKFVVNP